MENTQDIINLIPIRHNLVSYFIFLGIFLGLLLSCIILFRTSSKITAFKLYGWSLLIQSIIAFDVFLCYTGLMKYVPYLNDSTEPLVLLIAPLTYLFVYSLLARETISIKKFWFHGIPSILYFLTQIQYYLQPNAIKINAYLGAYFPDMRRIDTPKDIDYSYLIIKDEFRWLILFSFMVYIILSARIILKNIYHKNKSSAIDTSVNKYQFSRNVTFSLFIFFVLIFMVYLNFEDDGGDHYIFIFYTIIVSLTTFLLLVESRVFTTSWIADKYETTTVKNDLISIEKIETFVKSEAYYLSQSASLKDLSKALNANPNYVSQIINAGAQLNFNDFINQYRINEAKKRLIDKTYNQLTIEAIGESVGFKSKATFYNAFKKHVAMSPKAYIRSQVDITESKNV